MSASPSRGPAHEQTSAGWNSPTQRLTAKAGVGQATEELPLIRDTDVGNARDDAGASLLRTPFTPDTAPSGLTVRRRRVTTPLMLALFALIAALIEPWFPRMTYEYGRWVRQAAGDPSLLAPKQASIAIRPLFACLLILFAIFAAGTWTRKLRLLFTSLGLYLTITFFADVVLARLSRYGAPSPFMATGNMIAGLIGVLVVTISVFSTARLPRDVRIHRALPRRRLPPAVVLFVALAVSVAAVAELQQLAGARIAETTHVPLLGGATSYVVLCFIALPIVLCAIGFVRWIVRGIVGSVSRVILRRRRPQWWCSIGFIIPARDEQGLIGDCVRAIAQAAAEYPGDVHTIVVENGSTDGTASEVREAFAQCPQMRSTLLQCPALGKSRALNVGLAHSDAEIIVRVDADTLVAPDLLTRIVPHFWKQRVGGVGVVPVPREMHGWIAHMRAIETYYGAAFKRVAQNVVDCVTVLPGATVAYPRELLVSLGGFAEGINGEDADITVRIGRLGYRIVSDWRIRTYTDVPRTFSQLREQRIRWSRGLYHMIGRNRSAIWMRQGLRGVWMLPWAAFMMFRKLMLIPFGVAAAAMILAHPSTLPLREVAAAGAILLGVQLIQMIVVLLCYGKPALVLVLPSYLIFRLIVTYYALEALLTLAFAKSEDPIASPETAVLRTSPAASGVSA